MTDNIKFTSVCIKKKPIKKLRSSRMMLWQCGAIQVSIPSDSTLSASIC